MLQPKISLIITTYNWPVALEAVLKSVMRQKVSPNEVLIADDGSANETKDLVRAYQSKLSCPLKHIWQEDKGFRLARIRNKAISASVSDYIVMVDGDMILSSLFIQDHRSAAKKGRFVQGCRAIMDGALSERVRKVGRYPSLFSRGLKNRKNALRSDYLSNLFSKEKNNIHSTRGCNMSFWKEDLELTNGFNEAFEGWGREDSEFCIRMLNLGRRRWYLRFNAVGFHQFHNEAKREMLEKNEKILQESIEINKTRCELGLELHS